MYNHQLLNVAKQLAEPARYSVQMMSVWISDKHTLAHLSEYHTLALSKTLPGVFS